jgi:phosphate transport system permease protein
MPRGASSVPPGSFAYFIVRHRCVHFPFMQPPPGAVNVGHSARPVAVWSWRAVRLTRPGGARLSQGEALDDRITMTVVLDLGEAETPRIVRPSRTRADRVYRGLTTGAGFGTLAVLVLIGLFLLLKSLPAFHLAGLNFFTVREWNPDGTTHHFGIAAVLYGTVVIAVIALLIAVPVSIMAALFIAEYAPTPLRRRLTSLVDLLAAVPSLIYGLWGFFYLQPHLLGAARWLSTHAGFIPLFQVPTENFASSPFMAGCVVSLMVIPICTSVMREVFSQAPPAEKEAAMALGGTRWGMIRTVVLPFGRGGIIGGSMLGLGRALGETIAVAIILSPSFIISPHVLQSGGNSVASLIANRFGDASQSIGIPALMAAGLSLFVLTLVVNTMASVIVSRSRSGRGVEV